MGLLGHGGSVHCTECPSSSCFPTSSAANNVQFSSSYIAAVRVELCGTAIVFWNDADERGLEKTDDLDEIQGDCNKEKYIQRVILLEQGASLSLSLSVCMCMYSDLPHNAVVTTSVRLRFDAHTMRVRQFISGH